MFKGTDSFNIEHELSPETRLARTSRAMLGAGGLADKYQTMCHMGNLEAVDTYEGPYEVHTLSLGRDLTGIDVFS